MNNTKVYSPMARGNGAYIVHQNLATHIDCYNIQGFSPKLTLFPPILSLLRRPCDVIHTVPEYGDIILGSADKVVITVHNFYLDDDYMSHASYMQKLYYRALLRPLVTKALNKADRVIAVSDYTASLVKEYFPTLNVDIIKNGVDTNMFSPAQRAINKNVKVLFSGNPSRRKGANVLLDIAKHLPPNAELVVTAGLRNKQEFQHPNITLIDKVPYTEMPDLYRSVDIVLLPSYREGLSLAVLEAMACGLPVVVFDTSSMSELIDHGKGGYLCPLNDTSSLLRGLQKLIKEDTLRHDMGKYNREKALKDFKIGSMVAKYQEVFNGL